MSETKPEDLVVSTATLATFLNLSTGRVKAMAMEGSLPPMLARGRWKLVDCVHHYIAFLKEEQRSKTKTASETRVRDARAAEIEIRIARGNRDVIDLSEALGVIDDCTGIFLQALSSIPARITRDQNERRRIEAICDEERVRIADSLLEKASVARTGIPTAETDPEIDA